MRPVRKGSIAYREMVLSPAIWTILQAETYFNKIVRFMGSLQGGKKILAPCKLPSQRRSYRLLVLGTNQTKMAAGRSVANPDHFVRRYHELIVVIILLNGSYAPVKRADF